MPIKVLMFGWELPPFNSGGLGVACLGLAKALSGLSHQIIFVLPRNVPVSSDFFRVIFADSPHIKVKYIPTLLQGYITGTRYDELRKHKTNSIYGNSLMDEVRRYARAAREIARSEEFDIIHAHDWLSIMAGIEAKRVSGKPMVLHMHATEFDRTGGNVVNQEVYAIEKEGLEKADAVIAVSNFTRQILLDKYGADEKKISVIHNGVEIRHERERERSALLALKKQGAKVVLFVGRLTLQKGPDHFLRAAKKVLEHDQNVAFVIAGSGDMEWQIVREAAHMGIARHVFFAGFLRGEELDEIYHAADLFVMPSVSEPFGLTALEAMAHRTPVLISKQSGVSEALNHALKVDFWDIDEMANKIISVLSYKPLQTCLGDNGRGEVEKFHWGAAARKCMEVYSRVLGQHGAVVIPA